VFKAIFGFLLKHKRRIGIMGSGHVFVSLLNHWFDFVFYPVIICINGPVKGVGIMIILAAAIDLVVVFFYDKTKEDWLGIEAFKGLEESVTSKTTKKIIDWTRNRGDIMTSAILSFLIDPLLIMLYMRQGSGRYNGISGRDWKIFFTATIVGNVYWAVLIYFGIESVNYLLTTGYCS